MEKTTALTNVPTTSEWQTILGLSETLVKSGFMPRGVDTKEKAAAVILKGRELNIPPMQAFSHIHIIEGKPTCSAEMQLALLARGGVTWEWTKDGSDGEAVIKFNRPGYASVFGKFSMIDAGRAKKKEGGKMIPMKDAFAWKQYPANMLRSRAISNGARMIGPDLLAGMSYTPEELGAHVDGDGNLIETEAEVVTVNKEQIGEEGEANLRSWAERRGTHSKHLENAAEKMFPYCKGRLWVLQEKDALEVSKHLRDKYPNAKVKKDVADVFGPGEPETAPGATQPPAAPGKAPEPEIVDPAKGNGAGEPPQAQARGQAPGPEDFIPPGKATELQGLAQQFLGPDWLDILKKHIGAEYGASDVLELKNKDVEPVTAWIKEARPEATPA